LKHLVDLLSQVLADCEFVPDGKTMRLLAFNLPFDMDEDADFEEASTATNILLQCYFSRKPIPHEYL